MVRFGGKLRQFFRGVRYWKNPFAIQPGEAGTGKIEKIVEAIDEELRDELMIWRLVIKGVATLQEIETFYSLDDVIRANTMLDITDAIERATMESITK